MSAAVTTLRTPAETAIEGYLDRPQAGLAAERAAAREAYRRLGLPHRRIEAWHYTDLRALMRTVAMPAPEPKEAGSPAWSFDGGAALSFVDGWLTNPDAALPQGVSVASSDELAPGAAFDLSGESMSQLNLALTPHCLTLRVPAGVVVAEPLRLSFTAAGGEVLASPRLAIELGEGASLTLVESLTSPDGAAHQTNKVVEVIVGKGATFHHAQVNLSGDKAQTVTTLAMSVAEGATVNSTSFVTSPALARHQIFARVHGDDAKIALGGVSLLKRQQHVDHTLVVEHDALRGESRETFKTVVDDEARGVFQGKIIVKPHAQKTDGRMASNALLLAENASMHGKPELEIFADDVQCAHGATVGALDDDLLFYLMSRGIPRKQAEGLMIQAFAGEALEAVENESLREALIGLTEAWIAARA
jgi:Fe-S cluster assembly protein SufD